MTKIVKQAGRPEKAHKRSQTSLSMSPELRDRLEQEAGSAGMTVSEYIRYKVFGNAVSEKVNSTPETQGFPADWNEYNRRSLAETKATLERINLWASHLKDKDEAAKLGLHILEYQVRTQEKFASMGKTPDQRWAKFKDLYPEFAEEAESKRKA